VGGDHLITAPDAGGCAAVAGELSDVRRPLVSEYHRGPYRGPISGGLPGLLVVIFCLILTVSFARMLFPIPVIVGLVLASVAFFVLLRLPRRP